LAFNNEPQRVISSRSDSTFVTLKQKVKLECFEVRLERNGL
jgi:hypothetical protein